MATVIDAAAGWMCTEGASLIADATSPGKGSVPDLHATIYVCEAHRIAAEATITAAGYRPDINPAPPAHRSNPWPCGHVTAFETAAAEALIRAAAEHGSKVTHYAKSSMGHALCGADYPRNIAVWKKADTTCPRCLGLLAAVTPPTSIRTGIQLAETDLGSVVTNLSIWEGRGDWSTFREKARQESGARALAQLGDVIEALTDWRDALSTALPAFAPAAEDDQADAEAVALTAEGPYRRHDDRGGRWAAHTRPEA
jgi:hypothetical protein